MYEIVPTCGLIVQVAPVLLDPLTVAVNCCVWDAPRLLLAGPSVIETVGVNATTAVAVLVASPTLAAVTVTF